MSYRQSGKRLLDLLIAVGSLIVLSPLLLIVAFLIWLNDRGPSFFRQRRVGINRDEFTLMKFRSMPVNTSNVPSRNAAALKVTPIGKFIRRTSIDELPQLFNVVKGEMSIVGPRPALASQIELVDLRTAGGAYECLPGLTGLAQINGRDDMPDTEKAEWDSKYAQNISLGGDIKIILRTFVYLLKPPPTY